MATTYIVLVQGGGDGTDQPTRYVPVREIEAANAEKACRIVAEDMGDDDLAAGVTLRAIPIRNWESGRYTFKAETRRRLLKS